MRTKTPLRFSIPLLGLGGILFFGAFAVDWVGLSVPVDFGVFQTLFLLLGIFLLILGSGIIRINTGGWSRRLQIILPVYKKVSTIAVSTVLVFVFFETGAMLLVRRNIIFNTPDVRSKLPYYAGQAWAKSYWKEHSRAFSQKQRYSPYMIWRTAPYKGKTIHIDDQSSRATAYSHCESGVYRIFILGGSTMLGYGSPDWETIASHLAKQIENATGRPVCITNFGQVGYVQEQSIILLLQELEAGHLPDAVIFYDGFNDSFFSYVFERANAHNGFWLIKERLERPWKALILNSNIFSLMLKKLNFRSHIAPKPEPAGKLTNIFLNNYRIVQSVASGYGFKAFFFLQPNIYCGTKTLTAQEKQMKRENSFEAPGFEKYITSVYGGIESDLRRYPKMFSLSRVFDGQNREIWLDACHITPEGNRLVAAEMARLILPDIRKSRV